MTNIVQVEIGKGLTIDVDADGIVAAPLADAHIRYIGLRNILMDCHASIKRESYDAGDDGTQKWRADSLAASQKKLEALLRNEVRASRTSGPRASSVDPVEAEALRESRTFVYGRARGWEKGKKEALDYIAALAKALEMENLPGKEKDVLSAAIARRAAKPESIEAAKKVVEARNSIKVDVADLGL